MPSVCGIVRLVLLPKISDIIVVKVAALLLVFEQIGMLTMSVLLFVVRPRFPPDHITEVYIWAGKTRNITCHIIAEPRPNMDWLHLGRALVDNETYHIYRMSKDTNLQVGKGFI